MVKRNLLPQAISLIGCLISTIFCGSDLFASWGRVDIALTLPFGAAAVARTELNTRPELLEDDRAKRIALDALRTSPIIESALATLGRADPETLSANMDRLGKLTMLAGSLGWRNVPVQRQLYNFALINNDYPGAMNHADAILRVTGKQKDIEYSLTVAANIPDFRKAMIPHFQQGPAWSRLWLVAYGNTLSDDAVIDLVAAAGARHDQAFESAITKVVWSLIKKDRVYPATQIDAQMVSTNRLFPINLPWRESAPAAYSSPFTWQFGKGYTVSGGPLRTLLPNRGNQASMMYRLLTLPPGDYKLVFRKPQLSTDGWTWAMGCGSVPLAMSWKLEGENAFAVDEECPLQWLAVKGDPSAPELTELMITAVRASVR